MFAQFNRFCLELTKQQAALGGHQGQCDDDVKCLLTIPTIKRQLAKIPDDTLMSELKEYGAWDTKELADRGLNDMRIVWIACGNILEELK